MRPLHQTFKGRRLAALVLFALAVAACGDARAGWRASVDARQLVIVAPEHFSDCLVVLNSAEGGFHRVGTVDLPAGTPTAIALDEFTDARQRPVRDVRDALVQCRDPQLVRRLPVQVR